MAAKKSTAKKKRRTTKKKAAVHPLSVKQRKYIAKIAEGKTKRQAARDAGYTEATARNAGKNIETAPVREQVERILHLGGISDERIAARISDGLEATTVARETLHAEREVLTNFTERREMVENVLKLKGLLSDSPKIEVNIGDIQERLERGRQRARGQ